MMRERDGFQELISAALDDELDPVERAAFDRHLDECESCDREYRRLALVRSALRVRSQEPVPAMSDEVMLAIASQGRRLLRRDEWARRGRLALVAALATALLMVGTTLPWRKSGSGTATAAEIASGIRAAVGELTNYHAQMTIVERGWHEDVGMRSFSLDVWFEAPEHLRLELHDLTDYPDGDWPRNDVTLVAGPRHWAITEPSTCPVAVIPDCPVPVSTETTAFEGRGPFDGTTPLPTDLILPLESVANAGTLEVVGSTSIADREAVVIELSVPQAQPLLEALRPGNYWTPVPSDATVQVSLDRDTWFPLGVDVRSGDRQHLRVRTVAFETDDVRFDRSPQSSSGVRDLGWREIDWAEVAPLEPGELHGLEQYRAGRMLGTTVLSYEQGMEWLRVSFAEPQRPPIDPGAVVQIADGVVGYYLPAGDRVRRSIDIFTSDGHVRLESNLTRQRLIEVARSLDISGRVLRARTVAEQRLSSLPFMSLPGSIPSGYSFSSGSIVRSKGRTTAVARYRGAEFEPFGDGIEVTASTGITILPPTAAETIAVDIDGRAARWVAESGLLEWIDGPIYRSVTVDTDDLALAYEIAASVP